MSGGFCIPAKVNVYFYDLKDQKDMQIDNFKVITIRKTNNMNTIHICISVRERIYKKQCQRTTYASRTIKVPKVHAPKVDE